MKEYFFRRRWFWRNRKWKPTRQKIKAFERDLAAYKAKGVTPW